MKKTYLLWFAILAFLLGSCTREELYTKPNENYSGQKFKIRSVERITFDEMQQKLPAGVFPSSIRLSAANGRSVEEFDIDSTLVKQILFDENGASYTMRIIPKDSADTENELYNFTISQNNGATEEKIIRYTLEDGEVIADEEHTEVVYSKSSQGNCIMIFVPCEYGNYHHDGSTCEGHGSSIIIMCPGGGTTGGGGEPGEPGG
ncbi:MAG: hypothetical protein E2590_14945, partial [Chryseobacterium sp.]|nr:hypothetical protein [Chryseobacterium sp.]